VLWCDAWCKCSGEFHPPTPQALQCLSQSLVQLWAQISTNLYVKIKSPGLSIIASIGFWCDCSIIWNDINQYWLWDIYQGYSQTHRGWPKSGSQGTAPPWFLGYFVTTKLPCLAIDIRLGSAIQVMLYWVNGVQGRQQAWLLLGAIARCHSQKAWSHRPSNHISHRCKPPCSKLINSSLRNRDVLYPKRASIDSSWHGTWFEPRVLSRSTTSGTSTCWFWYVHGRLGSPIA